LQSSTSLHPEAITAEALGALARKFKLPPPR
jgi:hypothetical protein